MICITCGKETNNDKLYCSPLCEAKLSEELYHDHRCLYCGRQVNKFKLFCSSDCKIAYYRGGPERDEE